MAYTPTIYDWRRSLCPTGQVFRGGGQSIEGGMMQGGAMASNPEPGGRGELFMTFPAWRKGRDVTLDISWTLSRITNGCIMRVPLVSSVQLVPWIDLDIDAAGQTWANGEAWAGGALWRASPFAPVAAAADAGAERFVVDLSLLGPVLRIGHVIGFFLEGYDFTHIIMDIDHGDDDAATITISPPLRRNLTASDRMLFRPTILATCRNAAEALIETGRRSTLGIGALQMVEALV